MLGAGMNANDNQCSPSQERARMNRHLRRVWTLRLLSVLLLLMLPAVVKGQSYTNDYGIWTYTTHNGTVTITGYSEEGSGPLSIPSTVNGLPVTSITSHSIPENCCVGVFGDCISPFSVSIPDSVTSIGESAFNGCVYMTDVTIPSSVTNIGSVAFGDCGSLTSLTIPSSVTGIGDRAFYGCGSLTAITVDALNPIYAGVGGVLLNKTQTTLILCPGGKAGSYTIPDGVTTIHLNAFDNCSKLTSITVSDSVTNIDGYTFQFCYGLTNITIGNGVTSIGDDAFDSCNSLGSVTIGRSVASIAEEAFSHCGNLTNVYFLGNAPTLGPGASVFFLDLNNPTVYYLPGTTGWSNTFSGSPAVLWNPQVQPGSYAVKNNQFGFNITGSSNLVVVIEATTNLANPTWLPLQTNTLNGSSLYFAEPQWTNYGRRFYRVTWP